MARFSFVAAFMLLAAMSSALPTGGDAPLSLDKAVDEATNAASQAIQLQESSTPTPSSNEFFATPTPTPFGLSPSSTPTPSSTPSNPLASLPIVGPLAAALLGSGGQ
ncbi:hypothetical protein PVAR5_4148 [Paecilomyces variotii No. 5]|uniref:Uncharacterized protein n=1 Tax=Byssochlamys spectabilis (strain No. 5 / NBRC 109023) TaxID=1356009 RepID=V5HZM7_BYSSN|nr:hypothetical protein PVAR5_4148 [Paecilomyces variotii No. 5]